MKILRHTSLLALSLLFIPLAVFAQSPSAPSTRDQDTAWRQSVEAWRAQRQQELTSPQGWLTLVALAWVRPGDNTLGSAPDNSIQLRSIPAHLGILHLDGDTVTMRPAADAFPAGLLVNGQPARPAVTVLVADEDHPALALNSLTLCLIHRGGSIYLRVKDTQAETLRQFHGLNWYAPDPRYMVRARWIPTTPPEKLRVPNVLGQIATLDSPGIAEFMVDGQTVRLQPVLEDPGDNELFFIFRDATSATTTYPAGRFLYTAFPDHGLDSPGAIVLDFNLAFNPPCCFTPYATCPLPPHQNRLKIAIPAGEKRYHDE